jgi:hypothetical protein
VVVAPSHETTVLFQTPGARTNLIDCPQGTIAVRPTRTGPAMIPTKIANGDISKPSRPRPNAPYTVNLRERDECWSIRPAIPLVNESPIHPSVNASGWYRGSPHRATSRTPRPRGEKATSPIPTSRIVADSSLCSVPREERELQLHGGQRVYDVHAPDRCGRGLGQPDVQNLPLGNQFRPSRPRTPPSARPGAGSTGRCSRSRGVSASGAPPCGCTPACHYDRTAPSSSLSMETFFARITSSGRAPSVRPISFSFSNEPVQLSPFEEGHTDVDCVPQLRNRLRLVARPIKGAHAPVSRSMMRQASQSRSLR